MAVAEVGLPFGRALTREDLDAMPDDGHRHELVDGVLVVTPAPSWQHQAALGGLFQVLAAACPTELRVLFAPLDVVLSADTVVEPDLLVARRTDFGKRDLPVAPLLAVEILSPSTRRYDLTLKRSRYEAAGCRSYWVVDPDEPSVTAWELSPRPDRGVRGVVPPGDDRAYVLAGEARGDESLTLALPYEVTIVPARLLD